MVKLTIVPLAEKLSDKEEIMLGVKRMTRPEGMIQCNRCGSRTIMNTVNGAFIKNGRKQGGTKIKKDVCYNCHMEGIFSPMIETFKIVKKKK